MNSCRRCKICLVAVTTERFRNSTSVSYVSRRKITTCSVSNWVCDNCCH